MFPENWSCLEVASSEPGPSRQPVTSDGLVVAGDHSSYSQAGMWDNWDSFQGGHKLMRALLVSIQQVHRT